MAARIEELESRWLLSTWFVDSAAPGSNNGTSWANAYTTLSAALAAAGNGDTIEISQGVYTPTAGADRNASFDITSNGVTILGGYAGYGAGDPDARDPAAFETVLSGNIGDVNANSDNSFHVLYIQPGAASIVLDGLTITGGNANGQGNSVSGLGGAVLQDTEFSIAFSDCVFVGNIAQEGGAIYNIADSRLSLVNCTITANSASLGGGIFSVDGSPVITNCLIWNNTAYEGSELNEIAPTNPNVSYSDIEGGYAGTGNINADPLFLRNPSPGPDGLWGTDDDDDGDLRLSPASLGVDAGNNAAVPAAATTDLVGTSRFEDVPTSAHSGAGTPPIVDMGAFEATASLAASAGGPYVVVAGGEIALDGNGASDVVGPLQFAWDFTDSGQFTDATGADPVFSAADLSPGSTVTISVRVTDADSNSITSSTTITIVPTVLFVDGTATGTGDGSSWTNAFTSLTTALASAVTGETIEVAQGTYTPPSGPYLWGTFQLIDGVSVLGGFAGLAGSNPDARDPALYSTILSGNFGGAGAAYHVVTASETDSTAVLDGFTVTGGGAGTPVGVNGGGLYDWDGSPTISNCIFTGNFASPTAGDGGAVAIFDFCNPTFTNCQFIDNTAFDGGGVYFDSSSPVFTDCLFQGNTANTGGGIYNSRGDSTSTGCTFIDNSAVGNGGGIYMVSGNQNVTDCIFTGNTAQNGAGFYSNNSSLPVVNSLFVLNRAALSGGGIFITSTSLALDNSTFDANSASTGGALLIRNGSAVVTNTILWNNSAPTYPEINATNRASLNVSFSDVDGGASGRGNINADPLFVDPANGNFQIQFTSPALNGGDDGSIPSGTIADLAGNPRIVGPSVDMGAYENQTPQAMTQLVFVQQPTNAVAGVAISPAIVVDVEDRQRNILTDSSANVTFAIESGPGILMGTVTVAAVNGVATFSDAILQTAGSYVLMVSDDAGDVSATSASFTISPAEAANIVYVQQPTGATAGQPIAPDISVRVEDAFGNAITGNVVTLSVASGPGDFVNSTLNSTTDAYGIALFDNMTLEKAGAYTAAVSNALTSEVSEPFTITPAAAHSVVFIQQPTGASAEDVLSPAVIVQVEDQFDNPIAGDSIVLSIAHGPSHALQGNLVQIADAEGIATFSGLTIATPGDYVLKAVAGGVAAISDSFTVTGSLALVKITQQSGNITAGQDIGPIIVKLKDAAGNVITSDNSDVTLQVASGPGILSGTVTVAAVNGIATFSQAVLTHVGTYYLSATQDSITSAPSAPLTVTAAIAGKLKIVQQPGNTVAGHAVQPAILVKVKDLFGNPITTGNFNITLEIASGPAGATLDGVTTVAAVNGIADFSDIRLTTAGNYALKAIDGTLTPATTDSFTINAAAPARLVFVQPPTNEVVDHVMTPPVQVEVLDVYGNVCTNSRSIVTLLISGPKGATFVGPTTLPTAGGIATFGKLIFLTAGDYILTATDTSLA